MHTGAAEPVVLTWLWYIVCVNDDLELRSQKAAFAFILSYSQLERTSFCVKHVGGFLLML